MSTYEASDMTRMDILLAIQAAHARGLSPSVQELADAVYRSRGAVRHHLRTLEGDGLVIREPRKHCSLALTEAGRQRMEVGE